MCRILFWRLQKGYMHSDEEKAILEAVGDIEILYIACFYSVCLEFLSKLLSVSGAYTYGVQSGSFFYAFMA